MFVIQIKKKKKKERKNNSYDFCASNNFYFSLMKQNKETFFKAVFVQIV